MDYTSVYNGALAGLDEVQAELWAVYKGANQQEGLARPSSEWKAHILHEIVAVCELRAKMLGLSTSSSLNLDVDALHEARAVHRIVRAMNDGECPSCGRLNRAEDMRRFDNDDGLRCPNCRFFISGVVVHKALLEFGPIMRRSLKVFQEWKEQLT